MLWEESIKPGVGTAMAFEYVRRTRAPSESFSPPDAILAVHKGDWHTAMADYSTWAHNVWKWRPHPSRLRDCWNISTVGWGRNPLYRDGAYRTDFFKKGVDVLELMAWWGWSDVGPWRVPVDRLRQILGETFYEQRQGWCHRDPATGKQVYRLNCPDYNYNAAWGGPPALREYIQTIERAGILPIFYMNGRKACDSSEVGHRYGPKYGVMNPRWADPYKTGRTPKGYAGPYAAYQMCADTEWWQDYLARTVGRVCADTGIPGLRLDEFGHSGLVCYSTEHRHMFAEPGHNACLQATSEACRKVHAAMDKVAPNLVLTTEYPGYDHLARFLEGGIIHETASADRRPIRPVPCNLFRFYFPEFKGFDFDVRGHVHAKEWRLWNAIGAYAYRHPPLYHAILRENGDLFEAGAREALVPTPAERVYANRFTSEEKQVTLLYNARGYTVDGPLAHVEPKEGHHFLELLRCEQLTPERDGERCTVGLKLRRGQVACIARLPKRLHVARNGKKLVVQVAGAIEGMRVLVADGKGALLAQHPAASQVALDLPTTTAENSRPVCVKLLGETYLVDAVRVPK